MMKTKIKSLAFVIAAASMTSFHACTNDDDPAKPEITLMELGAGDTHGNDHTATRGKDLHIEAEIVAEGTIDEVRVQIHPEGDHDDGDHDEWEVDTTYTKFSGLKNTTFHEHIDIDSTAEAGEYHFHITVTDLEGYQSGDEADLIITE